MESTIIRGARWYNRLSNLFGVMLGIALMGWGVYTLSKASKEVDRGVQQKKRKDGFMVLGVGLAMIVVNIIFHLFSEKSDTAALLQAF